MLIILEGQRNVGKSTVIDAFIAQNSVRTSPFWGYKIKKFVIERKQYPVVSMMRDWLPLCFDRSNIWLLDRGGARFDHHRRLRPCAQACCSVRA